MPRTREAPIAESFDSMFDRSHCVAPPTDGAFAGPSPTRRLAQKLVPRGACLLEFGLLEALALLCILRRRQPRQRGLDRLLARGEQQAQIVQHAVLLDALASHKAVKLPPR